MDQKPLPRMSLSQIINMNFGFFGIQFSFGLQQSNMSPIYNYLGANEASLPSSIVLTRTWREV